MIHATKKEKEIIADEIHNRLLDIFHIQGKIKSMEFVEKTLPMIEEGISDDKIYLNYTLEMVSGDFIQILGRNRHLKLAVKKNQTKKSIKSDTKMIQKT